MHLSYVALHEVTWCMVVWCTQNAPRRQKFHVAPTMLARCKYTTSVDIQKRAKKEKEKKEKCKDKKSNTNAYGRKRH